MKKLFKLGFTLIELLIVIAIIGILSGLIITNVQGVRERARDARRKSDLSSLRQALRLYYNDTGSFPLSSSYAIAGCGSFASPATCTWGTGTFAVNNGGNVSTYMSNLPYDPGSSASAPITYKYVSDGDTYIIVAKLENLSDQDIADSQARCPTSYPSYQSGDSDANVLEDYAVCEE
jgi:prepilin-type N-terminal cleavage/methylation domain-containing protein